MNFTRAASAVVLAGLGLALAAPAQADNPDAAKPLADPHALGTYTKGNVSQVIYPLDIPKTTHHELSLTHFNQSPPHILLLLSMALLTF